MTASIEPAAPSWWDPPTHDRVHYARSMSIVATSPSHLLQLLRPHLALGEGGAVEVLQPAGLRGDGAAILAWTAAFSDEPDRASKKP